MSRVEETDAMINFISNLKNEDISLAENVITSTVLMDIAKSLSVIADVLEEEFGDDE